MDNIDITVWLLTLLGLALGIVSLYWARTESSLRRKLLGRCLFLVALVELGATAMMAALGHAISLAPMSLASVFLTIAMLWESPAAEWQRE